MSTGNKVVQLTFFQASDAFINNRSQFASTLSSIKAADGHLANFWGVQVPEEGGKSAFVLSIWESPEHLKKFAGTDLQVKGVEGLKSAASGELRRAQVVGIAGVPSEIIQAGEVTEIVLIKPKGGSSAAQVKEASLKLQQTFANKGYNIGLGETIDHDGWFFLLGAWPSYQESRSTVQSEPYASAIAAVSAIAELEIVHAKITKHD